MSTRASSPSHIECNRPRCTERGRKYEFQDGYCSHTCERADDALSEIRHDHRFCSVCFRPRKVVWRPKEDECPELRKKPLLIREQFVGFEDTTKFAEQGPYGLECVCGSIDHKDDDSFYRSKQPYEIWLKWAIDQLRTEDKLSYHFDIEAFANSLWGGDGFGTAVGKALA